MALLTVKKANLEKTNGEAPLDKWRFQKSWNNSHIEARRAHRAVAAALRAGMIKRGKCEECGSLRAEGHHDNYAEPLVIRWLCRKHHRVLHAEQRRAAA